MTKSKDLLMSIQPKWVLRICNKTKTIEVRKTKANLVPKFRIFVYCTKGPDDIFKEDVNRVSFGKSKERPVLNLNGKLVGHCTCTDIKEFPWDSEEKKYIISKEDLAQTNLTQEDLISYGKGKSLYGYVLGSFMMYCEPLPLNSLSQEKGEVKQPIIKAPQSWCYTSGYTPPL